MLAAEASKPLPDSVNYSNILTYLYRTRILWHTHAYEVECESVNL